MNDKLSFGNIFTVIDKQPVRFSVERIKQQATSKDLTRQWPVYYVFRLNKGKLRGTNVKIFSVIIKDEFIWSNYNNNEEHPQLHTDAIRFGLNQINNDSSKDYFELDNKTFEELKKSKLLEGRKLTEAIKEFFYSINKEWQMEGISHFDILDNFYAEENEVHESMRFLKHEQFISRVETKPYRENRNPTSTSSYHINPQKFDEIESKYRTISEYQNAQIGVKVKVFISYSNRNKKLATVLKNNLECYGIDVFLAHQTIKISDEWEKQILSELYDCHVFVALVTKESRKSEWTDQEAGFAMAYGKKIIPLLRSQKVPHGFLNRFQAEKIKIKNIGKNCKEIITGILENDQMNKIFRNGIIEKFGQSKGFIETHELIERILEFPGYSEDQLSQMERHMEKNDQIGNAFNTEAVLKPFITKERRFLSRAS